MQVGALSSLLVTWTDQTQGETSVKILTSIREKDVFVVQSGSPKINDSIMELLILISACKGGSANKITGKNDPTRRTILVRMPS
jgi:phosphoribosylpyrophosphate synthetase